VFPSNFSWLLQDIKEKKVVDAKAYKVIAFRATSDLKEAVRSVKSTTKKASK